MTKQVNIGTLTVGNDQPLLVIAGPCQLESLDHAQMIAGIMAEACRSAGAQFIFKASYDKANRTSLNGKRGLGHRDSVDGKLSSERLVYRACTPS